MLMAATLAMSCSKDKNNDSSATHKVLFKAEASAGGKINTASYGVDGDPHTDINLNATTWSSAELTAPAGAYNANIIVNGEGTSSASTLKVQIYVDGDLKKEQTSNPGQALSVNMNYKF